MTRMKGQNMKIIVTEKAWYKKSLVEEGSVIDFDGDTVPVWGTLADGKNFSEIQSEKQKEETQQNNVTQDETAQKINNPGCQPEEQAVKELEALKDLAVENNVWVEIDEEKMTIPKQIEKFKAALGV